jgi:pyruvate/2-oxoglutarate dehydrogenase complex dihydrolipoamide acyltransferase (E2) component
MATATTATDVLVPDIGDFTDVPIIEIHVASGDAVNEDDPLVTLESDKATMDIPAPAAGSVTDVLVKVGDRVKRGQRIATVGTTGGLRTPQLHFELRTGRDAIDPQRYLEGDPNHTQVASRGG